MALIPTLVAAFLLTPPVPGSLCTPSDPDFLEYRYPERIAYCRRNVSIITKNKVCKRDGVEDRSEFTVDHYLPLSHGGNNHPDNLWCQHRSLSTSRIEFQIYLELRRGNITQQDAIDKIMDIKLNP